jgi:glucoamylase
MVLKAHEDKIYHGAGAASLTMPWGNCRTDENSSDQGYRWPLFAGERGNYFVAAGKLEDARAMLSTMRRFANPGLMLSEQVWEDSGLGTGSATPLAWTHAEYILLERSIQAGKVLDMPSVVAARYAR